MGDIKNRGDSAFRDHAAEGVPASGPNDPSKADIRALFGLIDVAVAAAQAGLATVATITDRDAFYATEANRGKLVYVNNNAGSATDAANGVYEYAGGAPRFASGFYSGVALVVQPLVDKAETAAKRAAAGFVGAPNANLYDAGSMRFTGFISTGDGSIQPDSAWAHVRIPIRPGQVVTWSSNASRPIGSSFLKADLTPVTSSQDAGAATANVPQTRLAPTGAAFLAFNIKSNTIAEPSQIMVNLGATASPYAAYDPTAIVLSDAALPTALQGVSDTIQQEPVSANLFNPASVRDGLYLSTGDGSIQGASGWSISGFIPVVGGESYSVSASSNRDSTISFFRSTSGAGADVSGFSVGSVGARTVAAPTDAKFMVVSVKSPTYPAPGQLIVNRGAVPLPFEVWASGTAARVRSAAITQLTGRQTGVLVLSGRGLTPSYVESGRSGRVIRNDFTPFPVVGLTAYPCRFNLGSQYLDGVAIRSGTDDDIAPDQIEGTLLGGNHGYRLGRCTANGHGKTSADEGSVWSSGGAQHVLVKVEDTNTLLIAHRTANGGPVAGAFVHVSGASSTAGFTVSAVNEIQWYPPHNAYSIRCYVDGVENIERVGRWGFDTDVQFVEVCDILSRATIIAWWIANGGARAGLIPAGPPLYRLVTTYRFDRDGQLTIHRAWPRLAATSITALWGAQVGNVNSPEKYQVPGAKPLTYGSQTLDYGRGAPANATAGGASITFDPAKLQTTGGEYAHRAISTWAGYALAVGVLPVLAGAYAERRANVANTALEIFGSSGKLYFRVLDKGTFTAATGTTTEAVVFRHIVPRVAGRPLVCPVRLSDKRAIVYIDWVEFAGFDQIALPADLTGRTVTVMDSRNATIVGSGLSAGSVTASVNAAADHAYLVLDVSA